MAQSRFASILFADRPPPPGLDDLASPGCFADLFLDRVEAAVTAGRDRYALAPFFRHPPDDLDLIGFRQDVFADLERLKIRAPIDAFASAMITVRDRTRYANETHYHWQRQRWHLDAARAYCAGVQALADALARDAPHSEGLRGLGEFLGEYSRSPSFTTLRDGADEVAVALEAIRYNVWIHGPKVSVARYDDEPDYGTTVLATFERFRQSVHAPRDKRRQRPRQIYAGMDHVQAQILDRVAQLFPDQFADLDGFREAHGAFVHQTLLQFEREVQFYLAYLDFVQPLRRAGLPVTRPLVSDSKDESAEAIFDLALASKLLAEDGTVVTNDVRLIGSERILVITGPNNGGKTTLARAIGQLHYLARLGCPVPGRDVRVYRCDEIFTHFERQEDITTLAGKLQDELHRLRRDLDRATSRSLLILNEMFASTTVQDASLLSSRILTRISRLDALGVCVTFLDELSILNEKTVSMVSTVDPHDPATRTYRVIRQVADGRAYAHALAEKYGLTYEILKGRLNR